MQNCVYLLIRIRSFQSAWNRKENCFLTFFLSFTSWTSQNFVRLLFWRLNTQGTSYRAVNSLLSTMGLKLQTKIHFSVSREEISFWGIFCRPAHNTVLSLFLSFSLPSPSLLSLSPLSPAVWLPLSFSTLKNTTC